MSKDNLEEVACRKAVRGVLNDHNWHDVDTVIDELNEQFTHEMVYQQIIFLSGHTNRIRIKDDRVCMLPPITQVARRILINGSIDSVICTVPINNFRTRLAQEGYDRKDDARRAFQKLQRLGEVTIHQGTSIRYLSPSEREDFQR